VVERQDIQRLIVSVSQRDGSLSFQYRWIALLVELVMCYRRPLYVLESGDDPLRQDRPPTDQRVDARSRALKAYRW
jgi:hypothetical protein